MKSVVLRWKGACQDMQYTEVCNTVLMGKEIDRGFEEALFSLFLRGLTVLLRKIY